MFDRWRTALDGAAPATARCPAETGGAAGSDGAAAHGSSDANGPDAAERARCVKGPEVLGAEPADPP